MRRSVLIRIAVLWVPALVAISLQPWRAATRHRSAAHDIPHFLAFFSTALLLMLLARTARQRICVPLVVVALGAVIEYAQRLLYRGPFEWRDLASDACAALLACLLAQSRQLRETVVRN